MKFNPQLWLLLWKDYLIRKRKPVTIGGVIWAAATIISLVIVRSNVYPDQKPTCQFASRALPSAGVLPFVQSFICTINNECDPLDEYRDVHNYSNSRLSQLRDQLSPVFDNKTVLETVKIIPNSVKLLSTVTRVMDNDEIHHIVYNGFKLGDFFKDSETAVSILSQNLMAPDNIFRTLLESSINFKNVMSMITNIENITCDENFFNEILISSNDRDISDFSKIVCNLNMTKIEPILYSLFYQLNIEKYTGIIGDIFQELSGESTMKDLGAMMNSMIKLSNFENYIPLELKLIQNIFINQSNPKFSYINLNLINNFVNSFESLLGDSDVYKSIIRTVNAVADGMKFLKNSFISKINNTAQERGTKFQIVKNPEEKELNLAKKMYVFIEDTESVIKSLRNVLSEQHISAVGVIDVIGGIVDLVTESLPKDTKRQFSYYITLIDKMLSGAYNTLKTNLYMEEKMYNTTKRHPKGVEKIWKLGPVIISKIIDGLSDAERVQILTRKIYHPGQMFCDLYKLQTFLKISKEEATKIKPIVCDSAWKNYITDVIESFGVNNITSTINKLASFVIAETLGKSNEENFIKVQDFFNNIRTFVKFVASESTNSKNRTALDWKSLFKYANFQEVEKVLKSKYHQINILLVTVNAALAREVISSNTILETYITPYLIKLKNVVKAVLHEIESIPKNIIDKTKKYIINILETVLETFTDKEKMVNFLTTNQTNLLCDMANDCLLDSKKCNATVQNNNFINFASDENIGNITSLFCDISNFISMKLNSNLKENHIISIFYSILENSEQEKDTTVNWTEFISILQKLHSRIEDNFGFLLKLDQIATENELKDIEELSKNKLSEYIMNLKVNDALRLGFSSAFNILQTFDTNVFNLSQTPDWRSMKNKVDRVNSLFLTSNLFMKLFKVIVMSVEQFDVIELPYTSRILKDLIMNLPPMINELSTFISSEENFNVLPIVDLINNEDIWPCSNNSISNILKFQNDNATLAIRAIERILCLDDDLISEWNNFPHIEKIMEITKNSSSLDNITMNLFYTTARSFNSLIENLSDFQKFSEKIIKNNDEREKYFQKLENMWKEPINIIKNRSWNITIIRNVLKNIDTLLSNTKNGNIDISHSTSKLWETSMSCFHNKSDNSYQKCKKPFWGALKYTIVYIAESGAQMVSDLTEYFEEISESNVNVLQLIGFTKKTGPYIMFDKLPDIIDILISSFSDQGFMKQIYRSLGKRFWDCERILESIVILPHSRVTKSDINSMKPYICPSLIHWVSIPVNENVLLDLFAKSQFLFFSSPVSELNRTFEELIDKSLMLHEKMTEFSNKKNFTYSFITNDWLEKFRNIGRTLISYNSKTTVENPYVVDTLKLIYLTEVTRLLNHMDNKLKKVLSLESTQLNNQSDLKIFLKSIERKSTDFIEVFISVFIEKLIEINKFEDFHIIDCLENVCTNKTDNSSRDVNAKALKTFCRINIKNILELLVNNSENNLESFIGEFWNITDHIAEEFSNKNSEKIYLRKMLFKSMIEISSHNQTNFLITNIKYAFDFNLKNYLQYLNMKLEHSLITLDFITGEDWWSTIKHYYNDTHSNIIMNFVENSPAIVEDILNNFSKIKIIRLLSDIRYNKTELLCNSTISEYIPDITGEITTLKNLLCSVNITQLYMDIKPIKFAAYLYDNKYTDNKDIDEQNFQDTLNDIREKITLLNKGPQIPKHPSWITYETIEKFENLSSTPLSEYNRVDIIFFFLSNFVDGITLFTNSTYSLPSTITPWIKQINLQLIKKDEYVTLFCDLRNMNITDIHMTLINDFHWDLALSEIVSNRNYTWIEMNKSLNILIDQIKFHIRDINYGHLDKLSKCIQNTSTSNSLNKLSLYVSLGSNVMKLIRASSLHFKNINGFTTSSTWQHFFTIAKTHIPVYVELKKIVNDSNFNNFIKINHKDLYNISDWKIDLNKLHTNLSQYEIQHKDMKLQLPSSLINGSNILSDLTVLQHEAFWSMEWFSNIILRIEKVLWNLGSIVYEISIINWDGLKSKEIVSILDLVLQVFQKTYLKNIGENLNDIIIQVQPLIQDLEIEKDLKNLGRGLYRIDKLMEELDCNELRFEMNNIFYNWEDIRNEVQNKTNITLSVMNTMQYATWNFAPILNADSRHIHIKEWVCKSSLLSTILNVSNNTYRTSLDKAYSELCDLSNEDLQTFVSILFHNVNYTTVTDNVIEIFIKKIISASKMSRSDGDLVIKNIGNVFKLIPKLEKVITNVSHTLANEPLIKSFEKSSSLSQLLYDSNFFSNVGNMLCGKPFKVNISRFYKVIAEVKDSLREPDQKQLNSLPNDFCKELYQEILKMDGGKILWSYAKPMLMGKILYSPNHENFDKIITNANETFMEMGNLFGLVHNFSDGFESVEDIIKHNISLFTMQKLIQSDFIRNKFSESLGDQEFTKNIMKVNLTQVLDNLTNITTMKSILTRLSNMAKCISLDRFEQIENEKTLEKRAAELMELNEFSAGVVFLNDKQYKIRMDIDNVPSTSRIKNRFWMPGPNSNFIEHLRYFRGFIQLQDMIDKSIIESSMLDVNISHKRISRDIFEEKNIFDSNKWEIYTQQMPYPCYEQDEFKTILYESQALIIAFFFSLILVVASIVRNLVWERETGNISLMCIMRMKRKKHTLSWFLSSLVEIVIVMIVLCLILKIGNILPKSNPMTLLIVLFNFGFSVVMFCYMVTSFFKSASLGAVSAVIIYLIFFMPYVIVISLEAVLTFSQKLATSMFMSTGFCYSLLLIARFEVQGIGLQWKNISESPLVDDPISVLSTCFIVFFDAILYFIIGYIINYIRFDEKINIDYIKDNLNELSVGVKIKSISKKFKSNKGKEIKALDNVSIDLHKGQITTLLGRNGAGKTTLIKILTGTVKPDSGSIIINKKSKDNDDNEKNYIGLCPQADILLEFMTSREHLIYYARLKTNFSSEKVKCDVESMLEIMGLTKLSNEPVYKLSGGLRRRLCVGLAFIANPHLVILDEPSSGVDPVARRDIWSLIVSLKGSRTILLTTHHLDEAELLSDTLIIMHKGKVLTHNSPLELKHKYGSGYSLKITYSLKNTISNPFGINQQTIKEDSDNFDILNEPDNEINLPERMKINANKLLNIIKTVISNCTVSDIYKNIITINIPFLNENGQSQNFTKMIQNIEEKRTVLNYSNMTIDCSSLEQVFLDICKNADSEHMLLEVSDDDKILESETTETSTNTENQIYSATNSENMDSLCNKMDMFSSINEKNNLRASFIKQILTLLNKRFLHYRRNYRLLIIILLLPAIFVAFAMGFSLIRPPNENEDPIQLSSSLYNDFSTEFVSFSKFYDFDKNSNKIIKTLMDDSINKNNRSTERWMQNNFDCECADGYQTCKRKPDDLNDTYIQPQSKIVILPSTNDAVDWIVNTQNIYTEKRYGGWSAVDNNSNSPNTFMVWYNNKGDHALPSYLNTLNSAILKNTLNDNSNITVFSHPLKLSQEQLSRSSLLQHVADVGIGVVLLIGFSLVPAGGVIYLVNERVRQEKRLQLLCGVSPFTYWISTLLWDIIITCGAIILAIIVFEIFALPIYLYKENIPAIALLLLLYGISCSSLMYILEKIFVDASLANMILFCSNVFIGVVGLTILLIIDVLSTSDYMDSVRWVLHKIFLIFPQFALGDGLVEISKNTIQAILLSRFGMNTYISPLKWELMGNHYLSLALTAILFFSINMCYEYSVLDFLFTRYRKETQLSSNIDEEDYDVITEKYRVELATLKPHYNMGFNDDMVSSVSDKMNDHINRMEKNDVLQIISLKKVYNGVIEKRIAVDNLTFGLKSGQCFGLLGVNGAGKSTTFKMLTGEVKPTYGDIYINGKMISQRDLCNGFIAYCPQVDSLDNLLTVYEHLEFYSQLRNLHNKEMKIKKTLHDFDLLKYSYQKSNTLSGGNKRKLCTAISLLGNSPIVLLDEPTSGMDPGARHNIGNIVRKSIEAGRCLLLSSHSLAECEILCQKVAVMALGKFLTIGPPNYLKNKFGGGYLLSVRLASPNQNGLLIQLMSETFPFVQLQNSHYCTTQFLVSMDNYQRSISTESAKIENSKNIRINISDIFIGIDKISKKVNIVDYSINQSSLDQVFINFSYNRTEKHNLSNDSNGQIRLSTLERQYSKNTDIHLNTNSDGIFVTKF